MNTDLSETWAYLGEEELQVRIKEKIMAGIFQIPCGWNIAPFSGNILTTDQVGEPLPLIEREPYCIHWNGESLTFDSDKGEIGKFHFKNGFSYEGKMDYSALELFEYIKPYVIERIVPYLTVYLNQPKQHIISFDKIMNFDMKRTLSLRPMLIDFITGKLTFEKDDESVGVLNLDPVMTFEGKLEESGMTLFTYFSGYFQEYLDKLSIGNPK